MDNVLFTKDAANFVRVYSDKGALTFAGDNPNTVELVSVHAGAQNKFAPGYFKGELQIKECPLKQELLLLAVAKETKKPFTLFDKDVRNTATDMILHVFNQRRPLER